MPTIGRAVCIVLASLTLVLVSEVDVLAQGAVNAFIPDEDTRCINPNRDYVWVRMIDLRATKSKGFLAKDSSLGVLISTTVSGATSTTSQHSQSDTEKLAFPSMAEADVRNDTAGTLILPLQLGLVTQLALSSKDTKFSELDFEVKLLQKKEKTEWGSAISTLVSLTNDLPLPTSPYTTGAKYFSKYANAAITKSLETEKPDQQDLKGRTVLQFKPANHKIAPRETCAGWAQTGSYLIMDGATAGETEAGGYVDINRLNEYCWLGTYDAGFTAKWTKRLASGCDKDGWKSLANSYIPIVVQAVDVDDMTTAGKSLAVGEHRFKEDSPDLGSSERRCKRVGLPEGESACLPPLPKQ